MKLTTPLFLCCLFLFLSFSFAVRAEECTASDYLWAYSACQKGERSLLYYLPKDANCTDSSARPADVHHLPCDVPCQPGTYLLPGTTTCAPCPAGSSALGGGLRISDWKGFPHPESAGAALAFSTWAVDAATGAIVPDAAGGGWFVPELAKGGYVRSGAINSSQTSILSANVLLVKDGSIEFYYSVDAELSFDGLSFFLDGEEKFHLVSVTQGYVHFSSNASRGYHTLAWHFSKDMALSSGTDSARIRSLSIIGTSYSDDRCTLCAPGSYAPNSGSDTCTFCPANTYSSVAGASECIECPSNEYSTRGSTSCTPRTTCTETDYYPVVSSCHIGTNPSEYTRTLSYEWREETTCDYANTDLPESREITCAGCRPGQYHDPDTGDCIYCPEGTAGSECEECQAGTATEPSIEVTETQWGEIESFEGATTGCEGEDCGTNGWVFDGSLASSGRGHGEKAESWLRFPIRTYKPTVAEFYFTISCSGTRDCRFDARDEVTGISEQYWYGEFSKGTIELKNPGDHVLVFKLVKEAFDGRVTNDGVSLHTLSIPYAQLRDEFGNLYGGSSSCLSCAHGQYSDVNGLHFCRSCPPGKSSGDDAETSCFDCPEDTYNGENASTCKPCGANVHSEEGSTECTSDCSLSASIDVPNISVKGKVGKIRTVTYSVADLDVNDAMIGPVRDATKFPYYFGICRRGGESSTGEPPISTVCHDAQGKDLPVYACQVNTDCEGQENCADRSLGDVVGLDPLAPGEENAQRGGLVIMYTGGDTGCGGRERSMNVTIRCRPGGGRGEPGPWPGRTIENTEQPCHYDILWESEYGCPLCTKDDYTFVLGECRDGKRVKKYSWKENPRACHDGVPLPDDEEIEAQCHSDIQCPAGKYFDEKAEKCTVCPAGTYASGAGLAYNSFAEGGGSSGSNVDGLPVGFENKCDEEELGLFEACSEWTVEKETIRSGSIITGTGESAFSVLSYTSKFTGEGYFAFWFSQVISDDSEKGITVSADGVLVYNNNKTTVSHQLVNISLGKGEENNTSSGHTVTISFLSATSGSFAEIESLLIYGDAKATVVCTQCPDGFYQDNEGQQLCKRCPKDTVASEDHKSCVPCPEGQYTLDGIKCQAQRECTENDFILRYTACDTTGHRKKVYLRHEPASECSGGYSPSDEGETVECAECPETMWRDAQSGKCVGCGKNLVYNPEKKECVVPDVGYAASRHLYFYLPDAKDVDMVEGTAELPEGWSTKILTRSGISDGVLSGWTYEPSLRCLVAGPALPNNTHYVSLLHYDVTVSSGISSSLSFYYRVDDPNQRNVKDNREDDDDDLPTSELYLLIDGQFINYRSSGLTPDDDGFTPTWKISLSSRMDNTQETISIDWIAVVPGGSALPDHAHTVYIRDINFWGTSSGSTFSTACSSGFEASSDHSSCVACPKGTSNPSAAGTCTPCPKGMYSSTTGSQSCSTCYAGTEPESDSGATRCITSCLFKSDNTDVYNLTELDSLGVVGPIRAGSSLEPVLLYLSVCSGEVPAGTCARNATEDASFHVCGASTASDDVQYNYGSELEAVALSGTLALRAYGGFVPGCSTRAVTTVLFLCDVNAGVGTPRLAAGGDSCAPTLVWASHAACRVCNETAGSPDYEKLTGRCMRRRRTVEYARIAQCNGVDRFEGEMESCVDAGMAIGLAVAVCVVGAVLMVCLGAAIWKNRKLTYKYTKLLEDQAADLEEMADGITSKEDLAAAVAQVEAEQKELEREDGSIKEDGEEEEESGNNGNGGDATI